MKTKLTLIISVLFLLGAATPFFASVKDISLNFEEGDYVTCSGIPAYSAITIEGWINHSNLTAVNQSYFTMLNEAVVLRKNGEQVEFFVKPTNGTATRIYGGTLTAGEWTHVAGTFDGGMMRLYVNGNLVSQIYTPPGSYTNSGSFRISNSSESMHGKIDDVRLWNVSRSQQQIANNRFIELTGTEAGLVSYWKFNEGSGNVAYDLLYHSHGTLQNMTDANWIVTVPEADWLWAKQGGGQSEDFVRDIATDANGNSYVTGNYFGIANFGSFQLRSLTGEAPPGTEQSSNIYVAKLDADGNYLWAKQAVGYQFDSGYCIATDSNSNVYVTGVFNDNIMFGTISLTSSGNTDVFFAKLDANGNWLWAKKAGGSGADTGTSIASDNSGNVYATGIFAGTATFGSTQLTSSGGEDIYIAKLDTNGNWLWAKRAGGSNTDRGYGIATDSNMNSYVMGSFAGTSLFDTYELSSSGNYDFFVGKLNPSGNWLWVKKGGGSGIDIGYSIDSDANGNHWVTGTFQGTATFGTSSLISSGGDDVFVAMLDSNGNYLWAKSAGGNGNDSGYGIASTSDGDSYITGHFTANASFGSIPLSSNGNNDIYVAKLDLNGNWLWAKKAGSSDNDFGYGITADLDGLAYVTGTFKGTVVFGSATLVSSGQSDVFIAKLDYDLPVLAVHDRSVAFGTCYIGYTSSRNIWLKNIGYQTLRVESFAFGQIGSPFDVIGHLPFEITVGDSVAVQIRFSPLVLGAFTDVLYIYIDAYNMPTAAISLSGTGASISQPFPPMNISLTMDGSNSVLSWEAVTETVTHEPIVPDYYLVFFNGSSDVNAPFYYHGATAGLQYTHYLVGLHSPHMFYRIIAYVSGSRSCLDLTGLGLKRGMSEAEVLELLR
ncbi:MAG: SBBP repeat-containing protein [Candidatus Cloacimonas sp.]|nr:SBBP repeat-containing protein [Candidatus Cloacimonas sp.]